VPFGHIINASGDITCTCKLYLQPEKLMPNDKGRRKEGSWEAWNLGSDEDRKIGRSFNFVVQHLLNQLFCGRICS
jgi:hypothetical protein